MFNCKIVSSGLAIIAEKHSTNLLHIIMLMFTLKLENNYVVHFTSSKILQNLLIAEKNHVSFFLFQLAYTNIIWMKDLWCSSTVWLLSTHMSEC